MLSRRVLCLAFALVASATTATHASSGRALEVQSIDLPGQAQPSIVVDPGGGYVLTWIDRESGLSHLRFATLDTRGRVQERGDVASGDDWFVNWADFPSLAIADNGDWVTFFLRRTDAAQPYAYEIRATRSTDRGRSWSEPKPLHDDGTPTEHGFVSLIPDGGDRVLASWLDGRRSASDGKADDGGHAAHAHHDGGGGGMTLRTAVMTREGIEQARELDELTCDCCNTDAVRGAHGPLIVYRDRSADEIRDIRWLERTSEGWRPDALVHADNWRIAGCPVNGPAIARAGEAAIVGWTTMQGEALHVRAARRHGNAAWSSPRELEAGTSVLGRVDAAEWKDGGSLVSWIGTANSMSGTAPTQMLRVAWLDRELTEVAHIDVAALPPGRATGMPRLASDGDGAVLVWTESGEAGARVRGVRLQVASSDAAASYDASR